MTGIISNAEREFIAGGIAADVRTDGRGRLQWRTFGIANDVVGKAHGSSHIFLDGTEIVVGVYGEVIEGKVGGLGFHVDCTPSVLAAYNLGRTAVGKERFTNMIASKLAVLYGTSHFNGGGPSNRERVMVLKKRDREVTPKAVQSPYSHVIDLACLAPSCGGCCWFLNVDVMVVGCAGGNVIGAASIATKVALMEVQLPGIEVNSAGEVLLHDHLSMGLANVDQYPLATVIQVHGTHYCVDPSLTEESAPNTSVVIGTTLGGLMTLCETHNPFSCSNSGPLRPFDLMCVMKEAIPILRDIHLACLKLVSMHHQRDQGNKNEVTENSAN